MPWSVGSNVTAGSVLTASRYNQDVIENLNVIGGAWTAYTPTWTNLTVGNATQESHYIAAGKLYIVRVKLTFGSTTSISTIPEFTLPNGVSYRSVNTNVTPFGLGMMFDDSASQAHGCVITGGTAVTRARFLLQTSGGTYVGFGAATATAPFTWTTSDRLEGQFMFEAA